MTLAHYYINCVILPTYRSIGLIHEICMAAFFFYKLFIVFFLLLFVINLN